jgi:hypothetical protein
VLSRKRSFTENLAKASQVLRQDLAQRRTMEVVVM